MNAAFIVGCSRYDDDAISDLHFPHEDADKFSGVVKAVGDVDDNALVILASNRESKFQPTRNNIIRELTQIRSRSLRLNQRINNLYFFFSGHGFRSTVTGDDYLIPQDGVETSLEDTAVKLEYVIAILREWDAKHTVLILDACRAAASGGKSTSVIPSIAPDSVNVDGLAVFWSCEPHQKSYEVKGLASGVFTTGLIRAFGEGGKCKTIYELDSFLMRRFPRSPEPTVFRFKFHIAESSRFSSKIR